MEFARPTLAAAVLAVLLAADASPARADEPKPAPPAEKKKDDRPVSTDASAKLALERFESDFRSNDESKKMNAIQSLGRTKNDLVTKRLGQLLAHQNPIVRSAAAMVLDDQYQNVPLAGELLRKTLSKEEDPEVLKTACLTLGRIDYRDAIPDMGELMLKSDDVFVKIEVLKTYAKMKDVRALLPILDLWLINPQGDSWEGGEEHYDSGASGDGDQKEAEKRYKEKHANDHHRGASPAMMKTYIESIGIAVAAITGEKLKGPGDLMRWLVEHEETLPFKLPGKVKTAYKEFQEKMAKKKKDDEERKKDEKK